MTLKDLGVTPAKEKQFNKKGIYTPEELVCIAPKKFLDYTKILGIVGAEGQSSVYMDILSVRQSYGSVPTIRIEGTIAGTEDKLQVTFFNQNFRYNELCRLSGKRVYVAGIITYDYQWNTYKCSAPEAFGLPKEVMNVSPVYPKIPGMAEDYFAAKLHAAWDAGVRPAEPISDRTREEFNISSLSEIFEQMHFPKSVEAAGKAELENLFYEILNFTYQVEIGNRCAAIGSPYQIASKALYNDVLDSLGFDLTEGQKDVLDKMEKQIQSGRRLNALVQGDVGSGKTAVAMLLLSEIIGKSGTAQAALMAPTTVLARQHYEDFQSIFGPLGIKVSYLGSDVKASEKKKILGYIKSGETRIVVGTHSLVSEDVIYKDLRICVVDEEQRFGVACKENLAKKGAAGIHTMYMSATPIPKTLAQAVNGSSIEVYQIIGMPAGRLPVITGVAKAKDGLSYHQRTAKFIRSQIDKGRQGYIVCPMIDANEKLEGVLSVEEVSELYSKMLEPYGVRIATLTGKDKKDEAQKTLNDFRDGKIDLLISTTVVEVGVSVKNASFIIIESAERFGLSQLHQLRGRVCRGTYQGYCVLCSEKATEDNNPRLTAMCETTDGFILSEKDLELRGPGDLVGTRQSGTNRFLNLILAYPAEFSKAQKVAAWMLDQGEPVCFGNLSEEAGE